MPVSSGDILKSRNMAEHFYTAPTILRRRQLEERVGLKRSTIYSKLDCKSKYFDPSFPKPIYLGKIGRSVGWLENEVTAYIQSLIAASRNGIDAKSERQRLNTIASAS